MEQVIKAYGAFMLEGVVAVLLMFMVFLGIADKAGNRGIFAITGARLEIENSNHKNYIDFKEAYLRESQKALPEIIYSDLHMQIGTNKLADYIQAFDETGTELPIKVLSILSMDGSEMIAEYNYDSTEIYFASPGIYTVKVSAVAANKKSTICTIRVPVS